MTKPAAFAALDVDYDDRRVAVASVLFSRFEDGTAAAEHVHRSTNAALPYVPGRFFERELPFLVAALEKLPQLPKTILVDGHVWLGGDDPGLGAHLFAQLDERSAVIGVAKRRFHGATRAVDVYRGRSSLPLSVTSIGLDVEEAAAAVKRMHGAHRIPTLLKRVDRLCRDA